MVQLNSSNIEFLSIKDSAVFVNKSESSIKRMIANVKRSDPKKYKNTQFFMFETLRTGKEKVYISKAFLIEKFNGSSNDSMNGSSNGSLNSSNEPFSEVYLKTIHILEQELQEKNKQIESLLERQHETNVLLLDAKQKLQLAEGKKRKWFYFNLKKS